MGILITGNRVEKLIFAAANYEFEGPNICIKKKGGTTSVYAAEQFVLKAAFLPW